jgi:hypothetical protein
VKRVRGRARFLFSSDALQAKPGAAGCTRAPVFLLLFTGAAQSMLEARQAPQCGRGYFAGRAFALRSGAGSGPPSTSTAACSQVRAISSKPWRCRCDLVSPAQRKHSWANSRNSAGDAGMRAPVLRVTFRPIWPCARVEIPAHRLLLRWQCGRICREELSRGRWRRWRSTGHAEMEVCCRRDRRRRPANLSSLPT